MYGVLVWQCIADMPFVKLPKAADRDIWIISRISNVKPVLDTVRNRYLLAAQPGDRTHNTQKIRSHGFGAYDEDGRRPDLASTDKETVNSWSATCPGWAEK